MRARASATRLARTWAYSFYFVQLVAVQIYLRNGWRRTYGLILDLLSLSALERDPVALVLQTLGSDQTLDLGSLGVGLLSLTLGLNFTSDDVLSDL